MDIANALAISSLARERQKMSGIISPAERSTWASFVRGDGRTCETPATPSGISPLMASDTLSPWAERTRAFEISYNHTVANGREAVTAKSPISLLDGRTLIGCSDYG